MTKFFSYAIIRKIIMASTGLFLISFLIIHLLGNLLLFAGRDAFNNYAYKLHSIPVLPIMEIVLLLGFLFHIYEGVVLSIKAKKARGKEYRVKKSMGSTIFSRTMFTSGSIVFIFLVLHLVTFKFGGHEYYFKDGKQLEDVYSVVIAYFKIPLYSLFYIFAILLLGGHLLHGFASALKTLNIYHPRYAVILKGFCYTLSIALCLGFISLPIYFCFFY